MGDQDESELPDEIFGALRLKRKVGGTGYMCMSPARSASARTKKNPYQARVKNKRTGMGEDAEPGHNIEYDSPGVGYCIPDPPPPLEGSIHYSKYTLLRKIEGLFQEGGGWRV